ncbi:MAG TPA: flagellar biosynthesis protein FlhB [Firmicutes bacterium]|nr:flagellar biosynthesis protein FlhB [Bacillota bacterium]
MQLFADSEKTEEATPRRLQETRKRGQVVKSSEVIAAANLLALTVVFAAAGSFLFSYLQEMLARYLRFPSFAPGNAAVAGLARTAAVDFVVVTFPVFLTALAAGIIINYVQVGFLFTTEPLKPQLSRINPAEGFKKIFSRRALFDLVKSLLKVVIVGTVAYLYVNKRVDVLLLLLYQNAAQVWETARSLVLGLSARVGIAFLALAVADYLFQRREHMQNLKMTRQEVKEELRQQEGDPHVRGRLRERMRRLAMHRMMESVPQATVVITNPTELAVALRYRDGEDEAPVVVAKGAGLMAGRIREKARQHHVPIIENKTVARMLFAQVEIGQAIPVEMYQAVAEILAVVYRLRR